MPQVDPAILNALARRYASDQANLDLQQNRVNTDYKFGVNQMQEAQKQDVGNLGVNMSERGLGKSGIALQQNADLQKAYNTRGQQAAQQMNNTLAQIARKRLEAANALQEGKMGL